MAFLGRKISHRCLYALAGHNFKLTVVPFFLEFCLCLNFQSWFYVLQNNSLLSAHQSKFFGGHSVASSGFGGHSVAF